LNKFQDRNIDINIAAVAGLHLTEISHGISTMGIKDIRN
jgi:hypothetical protein